MTNRVVRAFLYTVMEMCMMDNGKMASGVVKANSNISLEMCMMDSGRVVTGWARAPLPIEIVLCMRGSGKQLERQNREQSLGMAKSGFTTLQDCGWVNNVSWKVETNVIR
jgi:hypothetical protein